LKKELSDQRREQRLLLERILEIQVNIAKKSSASP